MNSQPNLNQSKKSIFLSNDMTAKVLYLAKEMHINFNQFVISALNEYIQKIEVDRIESEAIKAMQFYYNLDKEIASEWRNSKADIK